MELGINVFESNGREREDEGERIWTHRKKKRKDRFNWGKWCSEVKQGRKLLGKI